MWSKVSGCKIGVLMADGFMNKTLSGTGFLRQERSQVL